MSSGKPTCQVRLASRHAFDKVAPNKLCCSARSEVFSYTAPRLAKGAAVFRLDHETRQGCVSIQLAALGAWYTSVTTSNLAETARHFHILNSDGRSLWFPAYILKGSAGYCSQFKAQDQWRRNPANRFCGLTDGLGLQGLSVMTTKSLVHTGLMALITQ